MQMCSGYRAGGGHWDRYRRSKLMERAPEGAHQEWAAFAAMADNRWHQAPPARLVLWWHSGTPNRLRCRQAELNGLNW
jgi:hypothetical protein